MRIVLTNTLEKSIDKLDSQSGNLAKQAVFDLQVNPENPGFKLHRLSNARDKRFWSARVNRDIRLILHQQSDTYLLCYAGHHDDAYDWAENRKFEIHPDTGAPQFVEIEERIQEIVKNVVQEKTVKASLFDGYDSEYLRKLGVPPEWLDGIRYINEDNIDTLDNHIPEEALERLYDLAAGIPVPVPENMVLDDPMNHPDAARRFRVITDSAELESALNAPWEEWLVFLHPRQRSVVDSNYNGPAKVVGGAGTGKTVVALHRAARLAKENPGQKILLTTFSSTLADQLSAQLDLLSGPRSDWRRNIEVTNLHKKFAEVWREKKGVLNVATDEHIKNAIDYAYTVSDQHDLELSFFRAEWRLIIDPFAVDSWDEYRSISRKGRGTPMGTLQRKKVWDLFDGVFRELKKQKLTTWSLLSKWVATESDMSQYDHAIIDEAQDLGPAELRSLRAIVKPGKNDLLFCGDAGQQIYQSPFTWASCGLDIKGRSFRLRVNYRTTSQIKSFAEKILPATTLDEDNDESRNVISLMSGPEPELFCFDTVAEEGDKLAQLFAELIESGMKPDELACFARTDGYLGKTVISALEEADLDWLKLSDKNKANEGKVSIGTMHRAKGLGFRVVILVGCSEGVVPLKAALDSASDETEHEEIMEREAHLLYVACSRARDRLLLLSGGVLSPFLSF